MSQPQKIFYFCGHLSTYQLTYILIFATVVTFSSVTLEHVQLVHLHPLKFDNRCGHQVRRIRPENIKTTLRLSSFNKFASNQHWDVLISSSKHKIDAKVVKKHFSISKFG